MNASTLLSAQELAQETFGGVRLGHQDRTKRAVAMAAASLPAQMQKGAALQATYRFLQTREEARQQRQVLLIQDTTEVDYQQHPTTTGLGPIMATCCRACWQSCPRVERCWV